MFNYKSVDMTIPQDRNRDPDGLYSLALVHIPQDLRVYLQIINNDQNPLEMQFGKCLLKVSHVPVTCANPGRNRC